MEFGPQYLHQQSHNKILYCFKLSQRYTTTQVANNFQNPVIVVNLKFKLTIHIYKKKKKNLNFIFLYNKLDVIFD